LEELFIIDCYSQVAHPPPSNLFHYLL
jgi:hypothetical protein